MKSQIFLDSDIVYHELSQALVVLQMLKFLEYAQKIVFFFCLVFSRKLCPTVF